MPHSMPSSRASRRAISKASSSLTWITSSMMSRFSTLGNEAGAEALDLVPARLQLLALHLLRDDRAGDRLDGDGLEATACAS